MVARALSLVVETSPLVFNRVFEHILIDLDDTLYRNEAIPAMVRRKIQEYMVEKLGIPANQVEKLTQELYFQYGTTLAGLARSFSIDFDDWHKYVHGGIKQLLHRQPDTLKTLRDLNLQAHLLTNADALHVENCLTQLGLTDCFQSIFCFENVMELGRQQGLVNEEQPVLCKPNKQVYEVVMAQIGAQAASTIFIDDSLRNVAAAHELGIFTVLVAPQLAGQHVAGADVVVSSFNQLREVLPQIFVEQQKRGEVLAGVPVSVMAG